MASKGKPLRWGILSAGRIANDFALAVQTLPQEEHCLYAVAARNKASASAFATRLGVTKAYGSYDALLEDPEVDVVYIGVINTEHAPLSKMCLAKGKPVLCEKPATPCAANFLTVMKDAKKTGVFYMEALWTRCLPVYLDLQRRLLQNDFGEIQAVTCSFGLLDILQVERVKDPGYQGGVLLDIGIYTLNFADFVYGGEEAESIHAVANFDKHGNPHTISVTLLYSGNRMAQLMTSGGVELPNEGYICGTKGTAKVAKPFWSATEMIVNGEMVNYPFPELSSPSNFINSAGLRYEAEHVRQCILAGKAESDLVPHATTLRIQRYMDTILKQLENQLGAIR